MVTFKVVTLQCNAFFPASLSLKNTFRKFFFTVHLRIAPKVFTAVIPVKKCFLFSSFFFGSIKENIIGSQIWIVSRMRYHFNISFSDERGYTLCNMRLRIVVTQVPFSNEVWSLFGYFILYKLLQDCDIILRADGGFCWTCMSVYHAPVIKKSSDCSLICGLCCSGGARPFRTHSVLCCFEARL